MVKIAQRFLPFFAFVELTLTLQSFSNPDKFSKSLLRKLFENLSGF